MPPSRPLPTVHRSVELIPSSDPTSNVRVNQTAAVPPIPRSGTYTLIRILNTSLNPVDYKLASLPQPLPRLLVGASPHTPGLDFVGRVWDTNDSRLKGGDIVWGYVSGSSRDGAAADFLVVKGQGWGGKIPDGWLEMSSRTGRSLAEFGACGVAVYSALQPLLSGDLGFSRTWKAGGSNRASGKGGKVFINGGSGGVGTFAVQLAKHCFGCDAVVASCSGANADLVKSLGADEVIDYRSVNVVDALKQYVAKNGEFDLVVDNVGSVDLYWNSHHFLKSGSAGGKFIMVGATISLQTMIDIPKMLLWPTVLGGGKRPVSLFALIAVPPEQHDIVGQWMVEGRLRTVIEDENRFELTDIQKAFRKLQGGRTRGKISIQVNEDGR
ncbi:hypothetical protein LTS08_001334 [Lithohypha guttulata]|uniref:uncharacterized protein n=1 Tax=Lithohypha guttulata TaxID=1690604 RepID=UPI002DE1E21A|nr:hypothetical protein LTR51_004000 [Lithohypha guttulata]KAK5105060.1 hypothetical protein LTS08_001334 [Lithohypha guttulata]